MGGLQSLPALDTKVATPVNALDEYARASALKSQAQEQQLRSGEIQQQQTQLADQKAMTQAMQEWDGKDFNALPPLVTKHGGSANAVIGLKQHIVDQQTKLAQLDKDQLSNLAQRHDMQAGALSALDDVPDHELSNTLLKTVTDPRYQFAPQDAQSAQQLAQMPPDQIRSHLGTLKKGLIGEKAQAENALKQSETARNTAQAKSDRFKYENGLWYDLSSGKPSPVNGDAANPDQFHALLDQIAPPDGPNRSLNLRSKAEVDFALQQGRVGDAQKVVDKVGEQLGAIEKETSPVVQAAQLRLATAKKAMEEAITDGDPKAAAKLLIDGTVAPSQLVSSRKPAFAQKAFTAAAQMQPGWSATKADADYKVAGSPTNVAFFGSAKSLTDKGGTLDQLADAAKDIPSHQIPVFNTIADAMRASTGSGPVAKYASILLGVADDYSKVMGGGQGSDTSRTQALGLVPAKASPEARAAAIEGIRGAVGSQINSRIGNNSVLKKMYGDGVAPTQAPPPAGNDFFSKFGGKAR